MNSVPLRFIAFVLLCLCLAACATRQSSPYSSQSESARDGLMAERLTREAAAIVDRNPERAEAMLREALAADLYHGPAHNNLGVIHLKQGRLYSAASEFEWARKLMPGHPDPRLNLALTLEKAGRTEEAISTYASALEVYPDHLPSLAAMARLQVKTARTDGRTRHALEEIALRADDSCWREWARLQLVKLAP